MKRSRDGVQFAAPLTGSVQRKANATISPGDGNGLKAMLKSP
jgi:hypothetical protein